MDHYTVSRKRITDIDNCNLKTNYQILIIFGTNISDTTGHPIAVQVPTSPSVIVIFLEFFEKIIWI